MPFTLNFLSGPKTFTLDSLLGTFGGDTFQTTPGLLDTTASVVTPFIDKDGNALYGVDSEFGFNVTDFVGAEQKTLDSDYGEGFAGNIGTDLDASGFVESDEAIGLSVRNAVTDLFRTPAPLGTWLRGLGGETVKASTEHYVTMQQVLSDQAFPGDTSALYMLDDDLKLRDLEETAPGVFTEGLTHDYYVKELTEALNRAISDTATNAGTQTYTDLDFDRDGTNDPFDTLTVVQNLDLDGDGSVLPVNVAALDLDQDGHADVHDVLLNGLGTADITDLVEPNESTVLSDIAYGNDYSITLKDDGKLLYRFGTTVKRPNDIRLDMKIDLPELWTTDLDENGIPDIVENGPSGITITRAELIVNHDITNNPNDQIRPEDYENEGAIGRLPSYYVVEDPDDAHNTLWVAPLDSHDGTGTKLPSYLRLDPNGDVDLVFQAGDIPVYDPDGALVGFRNKDFEGNVIGTVLRDFSLSDQGTTPQTQGLDFTSSDLSGGFTVAWYTTVNREPFQWSYDMFGDDPYKNVYESFATREEAEAAGYTDDDLASGPRWRLTPNKFGQDLPGLEVPVIDNSAPPYQRDNIKYETGESYTTTINLLDWGEDTNGDNVVDIDDSPLRTAEGWMLVDPTRLDENADGLIDEGWSQVNNSFGHGDPVPTGPIYFAVSPNGQSLTPDFLDTAVYVKGDRQDSAKLYDIQLVLEYETDQTFVEVNEVPLPVVTYGGGQDQGTAVSYNGLAVELLNNAWKQVVGDDPFEITEETVLSFDFSSSQEGEIHGIGFDNDNALSPEWLFQLDGVQNYAAANQAFNGDYVTGSGAQHYDIPVGQFFTGDFGSIVLAMDDDAGLGGDSVFSNLRVVTPRLEVNGTLLDVSSHGQTQDAGFALSIDDTTLQLKENAWKELLAQDTFEITENTVLSFDFSSDVEGEIHAIGFDTDSALSPELLFQLDGVQTHDQSIQDFNGDYTTGSGVRHYDIPVGEFYTGSYSRLVLTMDDDAGLGGDSVFSNVTLTTVDDALLV
ncbi:hypothetical protein [Cognatishimia sp. F0-27]|uniref:hypothetical protein n=1 Tax=Cognatishimia sp. F0-27 TaxID=2816855 RepID=UPI001D0CCD10|nr:hypothetical protein [Cognatishimia sp. F0-27]MCC1492856.1 hypothetical protein [Cognatishimia sp. F0-27]